MGHPPGDILSSPVPLAVQLDLVAAPAAVTLPAGCSEATRYLAAFVLARRGRSDLAMEMLPDPAFPARAVDAGDLSWPAQITAWVHLIAGLIPQNLRQILPVTACPAAGALEILAHRLARTVCPPPALPVNSRMLALSEEPEPDFAEAAGRLETIRDGVPPPLDMIFWSVWAEIMERAGRPRLATACLGRAVDSAAPTLDAYLAYAAACLRHSRTGDIRTVWHRLPATVRSTPWSRLLEVATLLPTTRLREALTLAGALVAEHPDDWMMQAAFGYSATLVGSDDDLHRRCSAYLAGAPRRQRGTEVGPWMQRAESALSRVAALQPERPAVWNDLGHHHAVAGNLEQAGQEFRAALALDGRQRHAVINLPLVLLRQGRVDAARAHVCSAEFPVTPPPAIIALREGAGFRAAGGPDSLEWKRSTVFSYHWRAVLAEQLTSAAAGPLSRGRQ